MIRTTSHIMSCLGFKHKASRTALLEKKEREIGIIMKYKSRSNTRYIVNTYYIDI